MQVSLAFQILDKVVNLCNVTFTNLSRAFLNLGLALGAKICDRTQEHGQSSLCTSLKSSCTEIFNPY